MKRTPKKKAAIFVDGQSEQWYFFTMKKSEQIQRVDLQPKLPKKKKLKEQYQEVILASKDYDLVIWIVDLDKILEGEKDKRSGGNSPKEEFIKYYKSVKSYTNIKIIVVNPCLEYWFLLHFENTSKPFQGCNQANFALKKHLKDYDKSEKYFLKDKNIYQKLKSKQMVAIKNSQKIGDFDPEDFDKSVCEIYKLFDDSILNLL